MRPWPELHELNSAAWRQLEEAISVTRRRSARLCVKAFQAIAAAQVLRDQILRDRRQRRDVSQLPVPPARKVIG